MLLAEKFVLLALDVDGTLARGISNQPAAAVGVTGALITELAQNGHIELGEGRIHITGSTPQNPLLARALENTIPHEGKKLKSRLARIKHSGWSEVVDSMIDAGILGRDERPLRPTRHPIMNEADHEALLAVVRAAATSEGPMDNQTASLLALAGPCQMLEVVAPDRSDRATAKRRIAEAATQVPAAAAVKYVIQAMAAAASTAAIVASTSSG